MSLPNLNALEAEWAVFMEDKAGGRNGWTQDQKWRADNPGELAKLLAYREAGGERPVLTSEPGRRMVFHVDAYLLAKDVVPPPPNGFRWPKPALTNPITVDRFEQCTDNTRDYIVRSHTVTVTANKTSGRTVAAAINGGRHVVAEGVTIKVDSVSPSDDALGLIVEQGNPEGEVWLADCRIDAPNLITGRSQRDITMQHCAGNARAVNDQHGSIHPDVFQEWKRSTDGRHGFRRFANCTFGSTMTFVNDFTDETTTDGRQAPEYFEIHDSDFHSLRPVSGSPPLIGLGFWMGAPGVTSWKGSNVWLETSYESATSRRGLGDMLRYYGEQYSPKYAGYQILDAAGTVIYTREPGNTASADPSSARLNGRKLRYHRDPLMTIEWNCQLPPGGPFARTA